MRRVLSLVSLLLAAQAGPDLSGAAAGTQAWSEGRYVQGRDILAAAAFDADGTVRDERAFQTWAQSLPELTNELPPDTMLRRRTALPPDADWARAVQGASAHDALAEIVARARATSIVILNEAHYSPRDRAFAWQVARALRPLGYTLLAAEAISNNPPGAPRAEERLLSDGFVRRSTGHYTKDPVFAAYLREAVRLGYRPIAYEQTLAQRGAGTGIEAREAAQAANVTAALARYPGAKLLIHVGHSHLAEVPMPSGNGTAEWMAARLKRATGIDPLTIDQTFLTDLSPAARAAYPLAAAKVGTRPGVLFAGAAPLVLGLPAGAADLQVVHPARAYRWRRPMWLQALGGRATAIPARLLPASGERLVQAFAADAPADAVPLDQVLVTAGRPMPRMLLPAGVQVRWAVQPSVTLTLPALRASLPLPKGEGNSSPQASEKD